MKKIFIFLGLVILLASIALPIYGQGNEEMQTSNSFSIIVNLITLIVVGGIVYNLWINLSGFGGLLGKALKIIGVGIFILSIDTVHASIQEIPGVGLDFLFGRGLYHDYFHCVITLLGFIVLGVGLANLAKLIKSMK